MNRIVTLASQAYQYRIDSIIQMNYRIALWLAIGCTVVPSFMMSEAISRVGPDQTAIMGGSGPVIMALLAILILGEDFTVYHFVGMFMVIVAIMWLSVRKQSV